MEEVKIEKVESAVTYSAIEGHVKLMVNGKTGASRTSIWAGLKPLSMYWKINRINSQGKGIDLLHNVRPNEQRKNLTPEDL